MAAAEIVMVLAITWSLGRAAGVVHERKRRGGLFDIRRRLRLAQQQNARLRAQIAGHPSTTSSPTDGEHLASVTHLSTVREGATR